MFWKLLWPSSMPCLFTALKVAMAASLVGAIAIDRSPFMQRGHMPVGNFIVALPIVGTAPILMMWFGFDWQSEVAVVAMVFFPVMVNTPQGLTAADPMQCDQMETRSENYMLTLTKLRLPAAMPFIFNGLKIVTTLAPIRASVIEVFGSPIRGMGFRISTEVGRLALDMVRAESSVAALVGSAFYGAVAACEGAVSFWHPSQRGVRQTQGSNDPTGGKEGQEPDGGAGRASSRDRGVG